MTFEDIQPYLESPGAVLLAAYLTVSLVSFRTGGHGRRFTELAAKAIGRKLNRPGHSSSQLKVSAAMLIIITVVLAVVALAALHVIAPDDALLDYLILILIIDVRGTMKAAARTEAALRAGKLDEARAEVRPILLRETGRLSEMGVAKACSESVILTTGELTVAPAFWYMFGSIFGAGIDFAVIAFLFIVMGRAFNQKLPGNAVFGRYFGALLRGAVSMPELFLTLSVLMMKNGASAVKNGLMSARTAHPCPSTGVLLSVMGRTLDCRLGGPRFYEGSSDVYRLPAAGGYNNPDAAYIGMYRRKMMILTASMAVILCLITESALLLGIGGDSGKAPQKRSDYDPPKVITIPAPDYESEINRGGSIVPESGNKGVEEKKNGSKDEKKAGSSPVFSGADGFNPV